MTPAGPGRSSHRPGFLRLSRRSPLAALPLRGPPAEREAELARLLSEEAHRPFNLGRGPLLRATLFRVTAQEHTLLIVVHHIAFDAWSQTLFLRELAALYAAFSAGRPSPLPDLPLPVRRLRPLAAPAAGRAPA